MPSHTFSNSGRDLVGHSIDNGRLELLDKLGSGAYGVVYLAVDLHARMPMYVAVKCLLRAPSDSRQRHFQRREIALHQLASRHPNIVTMHKIVEEGDYIFVVMDFYEDGDLFGMITEVHRYIGNDELVRSVFMQIVDAVEYCHSLGIFHRDLKPENILCSKRGEKICIADFGLATSERHSSDFGCGSTFYLSPECQGGLFNRLDSYNTATNDIWSLGVILVNLVCGRNPWRQACAQDETFRAYVNNPDFLRTILPISHGCNQILKGLFALEPRERPSLKQLKKQILAIDTFRMTDDELVHAHSAARAAAAAVRPVTPPPAPPVEPLPIPQMQPQQHEQLAIVGENGQYTQVAVQAIVDQGAWSQHSAYADLDPRVLEQIDYAHHQHQNAPATPQQPAYRATPDTPSLVGTNDPYALVPTTSRSSSSGGNSLPPTPEFKPADKGQAPAGGMAGWTVGQKKVAQQDLQEPELLHMSPLAPLRPAFNL